MNLKAPASIAYLQKNPLPNITLIYGEEPLLNLEALEAVRQRAKNDHYTERQRITLQSANDWAKLPSQTDNLSLFAQKRLIELHCEDKKPNKTAETALLTLNNQPSAHHKIVLFAPNFSKIEQSAWYKTLFQHNLAIRSFTLFASDFNQQIDQRLKTAHLRLTSQARERLIAYCQNNLLAAKQAIERLSIHPQHEQIIDDTLLQNLLSDVSQFSTFALTDAILASNWLQAYKIAHKLAEENNQEHTLITWLIQRDMSLILQLIAQPQDHTTLYKNYNISSFQQKRYILALKHYTPTIAQTTLTLADKLDRITKGAEHGHYWLTLKQYLLLRAQH